MVRCSDPTRTLVQAKEKKQWGCCNITRNSMTINEHVLPTEAIAQFSNINPPRSGDTLYTI